MALFLIGIGLNDENDITLKGLELVRKADVVYLESYTSLLHVPLSSLEKLYGKKVILADRDFVEKKGDAVVAEAKKKDVAFLVIGDVFGATTHTDLYLRALNAGVLVGVVHNASILTAIGKIGLELYKFGKTTSIPYSDGRYIDTPYLALKDNLSLGMHTLLLLDIQADKQRFMSVNEALTYLLETERRKKEGVFSGKTLCIGIARIGSSTEIILSGTAGELLERDFGKPPHALIIPGKLHFMEEEMLQRRRVF
ncbi:MAG: diphthine synthase [archaeon]